MSKKPSSNEALSEEPSLHPYFQKCEEDSLPVSVYTVDLIIKKIEDDITFKEVDKKKKPFAVNLTLSQTFKASVASVLRPDPRGDDALADQEGADCEPMPTALDNCTSNQKVTKMSKEIEIPTAQETVSHRSSPRSSTHGGGKFFINALKKKIDSEIASAQSKLVCALLLIN